MIQLTIIEQAVLDLIPSGDARVTIKEISQLIDLNQREVFEVVNSLRRKGVPVCANRSGTAGQRGHYIATTEAELNEGMASYKAQIADMSSLVDTFNKVDVRRWRDLIASPDEKKKA